MPRPHQPSIKTMLPTSGKKKTEEEEEEAMLSLVIILIFSLQLANGTAVPSVISVGRVREDPIVPNRVHFYSYPNPSASGKLDVPSCDL